MKLQGPLTEGAIRLIAADLLALMDEDSGRRPDLDEIRTMTLQTAADHLGIPVTRAEKVLPVITLGPRSRRVTLKALKDYIAQNTKTPALASP